MTKGIQSIVIISLVPLMVLAIESINPKTVCDRFVNPDDIKYCQNKLQKLSADSYLSGICQKQFDDDAFWDCMEMTLVTNIDPKKLDPCASNELSDQQRLSCLKKVSVFTDRPQADFQPGPESKKVQVRTPATDSKN